MIVAIIMKAKTLTETLKLKQKIIFYIFSTHTNRQTQRQTGRQTDRFIYEQADKQIEGQEDREIEEQEDRQIYRWIDRLIERMVGYERQTERNKTDGYIDRQVDRS